MLTKESIYVILFALPVYQLLFYTVQLISFKRRNPSKKYLGILLLCMTTFLVINAIHFLDFNHLYPLLQFVYMFSDACHCSDPEVAFLPFLRAV